MLYATVRQRKIHVKNPVTVIQNGIGVDQVVLDMDEEWRDMTSIVCVFQNGEVSKEKLHSFGQLLEVPWECLTETGQLSLSCTGYVGSEKVMTTMAPDSFWNVVQSGPVTGGETLEPTPTLYEQVLAAANAAKAAAEQLLQDKENGVFDGESVEITRIDESAESGGENVVTFSDGNTLIIKNGKEGPAGAGNEIFFATYGSTTFDELLEAWNAKKRLILKYDTYYPLTSCYISGSQMADNFLFGPYRCAATGEWITSVTSYMPVTGGIFNGTVRAGGSYQAVGTSLLRNSKLVSSETYPTVNGEINWQYE